MSAARVDQTPSVLWGPTPGPGAEVPLRSWSAESVLKDPVLLEPLLCLCSCLLGPGGGCIGLSWGIVPGSEPGSISPGPLPPTRRASEGASASLPRGPGADGSGTR